MDINFITIISVFLASILNSVIWVLYIRRTSRGDAFWSSFTGGIITLIGAFIVVNFVDNKLYLIPTIIGGFIGQYFTMKYDLKKKNKIRKKSSK